MKLQEIADHIEKLQLKCRWCKTQIRGSDIDCYPHPGGVELEDFKEKQWVYFNCSGCDYDWALWKLIQQAKVEKNVS